MRLWIGLVLLGLIGLGMYYHYVTFDPLSLVSIALIVWTTHTRQAREQQLADLISKSHEVLFKNQKEILNRVEQARAENRRLRG